MPSQARRPQFEDCLANKDAKCVIDEAIEYGESRKGEKLVFLEQNEEVASILVSTSSNSHKDFNMPLGLDKLDKKAVDCHLYKTSHSLDHSGAHDGTEILKFGSEATANESTDEFNKDYSSSLLEKLFGGALTLNDHGSSSNEVFYCFDAYPSLFLNIFI